MDKATLTKVLLWITFISACLGLLIQLYVSLTNPLNKYPSGTTLLNFFSYFTIQSNILVALVTGSWLFNKNIFGRYKEVFLLGALIDISLTFIVVQLVLAKLYSFEGLALLADNMVHIITPLIFVGFWLLLQPKNKLHFKSVALWGFIYAPLYVVYTLVRGPMLTPNWYPYPFLDATIISYSQIAINVAALIGVFLVIGAVFVFVNNLMVSKKN